MVSQNSQNNTVADNDFSVNRATAGTATVSSAIHSDNTNTGSHATLQATSGGASGGDPFINFLVTGAQDYSFGIDNSDSDALKITDDADPSTGNNIWKMTSSGERTMSLQPQFSAYRSTTVNNVTGNGANYLIIFDSENYDIGSNYNTGNGLFTAPVAGYYLFGTQIYTAGNTTSTAISSILTISSGLPVTNTSHTNWRAASNQDFYVNQVQLIFLNASATVSSNVVVIGNAGDTVDIGGTNPGNHTNFWGCLLF